MTLAEWGWDDRWAAAFEEYGDPDLDRARVARVHRGACDLVSERGELRAGLGSAVRDLAQRDPTMAPCVGDWVGARPAEPAEIVIVLPRRTAFVRGGVGREARDGRSGDSHGQVLAANMDVVYVVEPAPYAATSEGGRGLVARRIERLMALAWESGAQPIVVITKIDLVTDPQPLLAEVEAIAPGVTVHLVSALSETGLEALRLPGGRTAVLLGPSGAGKSSLVNAMAGAELMATKAVRDGDRRGRHTTTHRELIALPGGGLVIDTPGLRRIGLHATGEGLSRAFAEIEDLAASCRFSDCTHAREPGCEVRAAVLSGELPRERLESWRKLRREAEWMASRTDARLRASREDKWKHIRKEMRRTRRNRP
jgi:ribosome biogenesis GTPase / thiamine phosphate phosphatase